MALHQFGLDTLTELDGGRVVEAWNQALRRALGDCKDRPAVKKDRKVTLELRLRPVVEEDRDVTECEGHFLVKDTVPTRESKDYSFAMRGLRGEPVLVFNDLSEDNVRQRTLDEYEENDDDDDED